MASAHTAAVAAPGFFREKILLGMTGPEYVKSLVTPGNALIALILAAGLPVFLYRFYAGLGAVTNLSQTAPWGIWIGFDMMTGIVLAAGGFTIGAAVQIFNLKEYHPIERPAILTAFLGYVMAIVGLLADLGRPWNIVMALVSNGSASVLYEVAWCVMCYSSVLALEFTVPLFEWLGWKKLHGVMRKTLVALTVLSVIFSTMHQSALGSLFLIAPTKLHPLWYTQYIFIHFFVSAIVAGLSMVIVESALSHKAFASQLKGAHFDLDKLTVGLGRAGALVMFALFFLKLQSVVDSHAWGYLATGYGAWYLVEIVGFLLIPALIYAYGARNGSAKIVRIGGVMGVLSVVLNRLNMSVIAFNWQETVRYVPSWQEVLVSVTLVTLLIVLFRWIVNRMPIMKEHPAFPQEH
ncbi:MAG TPA: NrfD/PsrC family molybdoenzyme membrane anchor subunit [Usitatibacteraceae bacterium]|nr:NrfD/PsrC family molybdoenzyme membrane anchor subunit [Usitatibacteraceae bacterium]